MGLNSKGSFKIGIKTSNGTKFFHSINEFRIYVKITGNKKLIDL